MMLVAAQAAAKFVPSKDSDSWLAGQEQLGGDTMQRHVGRSPSVLAAYLAEDPQSRSIGSFPDPRTAGAVIGAALRPDEHSYDRSEEHTSELQSLMRISYAVFCLKKKKPQHNHHTN